MLRVRPFGRFGVDVFQSAALECLLGGLLSRKRAFGLFALNYRVHALVDQGSGGAGLFTCLRELDNRDAPEAHVAALVPDLHAKAFLLPTNK
jgi:hypothetical protein